MIKGLTALLVAALVVFAIGGTISLKSQARYAAKLRSSGAAETTGKTAGRANGDMSGSATALNAGGKGSKAATNVLHQARLGTPRT